MSVEISDHALLRYIERAHGVPIEELRRIVAETPGLDEAARAGASAFSHDGLTYRIKGGHVVTVQGHGSPSGARLESVRFKHGYTVKARGPRLGKSARGRGRDRGRHDREYDEAAE